MKRYEAKGYTYAKYYSVECPNCKKEAIVEDGKLLCKHCFEKREWNNTLFDIYLRRNCPDCGKQIYIRQIKLKSVPEKIKVMCPNCFYKMEEKPTVERSYMPKPDLKGLKGDPYFGFPLWIQTEIRGNLFWGYNREHLIEIETYIKSDLREIDICGKPYRMVTRLPSFIRDAKNRDIVIKTIERLLKK